MTTYREQLEMDIRRRLDVFEIWYTATNDMPRDLYIDFFDWFCDITENGKVIEIAILHKGYLIFEKVDSNLIVFDSIGNEPDIEITVHDVDYVIRWVGV